MNKVVKNINDYKSYYKFLDQVESSNTYKHGWFVYACQFNEGDKNSVEYMLGDGLTEDEAQKLYDANRFAVEHSGYDYADIYMDNLYRPHAPVIEYNRITKTVNKRAVELQSIYQAIFAKIN